MTYLLARGGRRIAIPLALLAALGLSGCGRKDSVTAPDREISGLAVVIAPQAAITGRALSVAPVVELRSSDGRPVETAGVLVTVMATGGVLGGTTSATTNDRGRAEFADLTIEGDPGSVRLAFSCCSVPAAVATLSLSQGAGLVALVPTTQTGKVGSQFSNIAVRAVADDLRGIQGVTVRFEFSSGRLPATSVTTGADGVATLPTFALSLVTGTEVLTATDIATGKVVTFQFATIPDPQATLVGTTEYPVTEAGTTVTLPALRVTNGLPVEGAAVSYRITSGSGVLSTATTRTDATGTSAPVTLTLERGLIQVEISAGGYSQHPETIAIVAVVPPVSLAYLAPCPCPAFDLFTIPGDNGRYLRLEVRDAVGPVPFFPVQVTTAGDVGYIASPGPSWDDDVSHGGTILTGDNGGFALYWRLSETGTGTVTLSGSFIQTPWTYRSHLTP